MSDKVDYRALEPKEYWVEVDPETFNPTGNVCWAYYESDKPIEGHWIKVRKVNER